MAPYLLVIDDDPRLRQLLGQYLTSEGFLVSLAKDTVEAQEKMALMSFDALVLDVMMPGQNGVDFTQQLRRTNNIPVLMLTAQGQPEHRITGLEAGVDDYLAKPFEPRELALRLKALLRRLPQEKPASQSPKIGPWTFAAERDILTQENNVVRLTPTESQLLKIFLARPGHVYSREDLARALKLEGASRTVDVQVTRLRKKIESNARQPHYLQTIRGEGYVLWPH